MVWSLVLLSVVAADPTCGCAGCANRPASEATTQRATAEQSASYRVVSRNSRFSAARVGEIAESQRSHLFWHWRGAEAPAEWNPKCEIVVHATRASYTAAVGRGSEFSFGSSLIDNRGGRCVARRIDLLADSRGELSALPHELTHVVISDMLGSRIPPRWLDEGIALLADSLDKQQRHAKDLTAATARRQQFRAAELMQLQGYPHPSRIPAFYAQSGSLVAFLARKGEPAKLLTFVERSQEKGYDAALREIYDIDGMTALEREWLADDPTSLAYSQARSRAFP